MFLIRKYIIKEIFLHFFATFFLLFFIFSSNQCITLLTKVANGKLPLIILGKLMLLYSPEIFGCLIPVSLFIATLFVISKLYADNEVVVLFTSGIIWDFLIKTIMCIALVLALFNGIITLWLIPNTIESREKIVSKSEASLINAVIPGQFNVINDGKQVFYVEEINNNNFQDIFIATNGDDLLDSNKSGTINIITAKSGYIKTNHNRDNSLVVLRNGNKYSGLFNNTDFFVINFNEYGKSLLQNNAVENSPVKTKKTKEILNSKNLEEIAEYQWRLAMPIATIILSMLAIGLGKVIPRQGRFAKFFPAVLLYIIYSNSMLFVRRLVAGNVVPAFLGIWMVHIIFLIIAIILLLQSSGWLLYLKQKLFKF